jgi:hypothetical protein
MKHLQDLPNIEGFRFVGITHDNERRECFVAKDLMGCHTIKGEATWFDLDGWEDASPKQRRSTIYNKRGAVANKPPTQPQPKMAYTKDDVLNIAKACADIYCCFGQPPCASDIAKRKKGR